MTSEELVLRVRGEYREMPGLRLTFAQACRLWALDATTCNDVLARLIQDQVLHVTSQGHYMALPAPRMVAMSRASSSQRRLRA